MLIPTIPSGEADRLKEIEVARILDTPLQEGFERITRITKNLFNMPIVAISIIDGDRHWFKFIQGFDVCETPRDISFCGHAILQEDIFVISDTHLDDRFADNPLVINDPYIRFYAGCPLKSPGGYKYGTLCLIDQIPREFTRQEVISLQDMGNLAETEILKQSASFEQNNLLQHLDQAKRALMIDPLTRLWNREGMINILNNQLEEYAQTGKAFGIALLDIDHFKLINDTYGHSVGDKALRSLAKTLVSLTREKDACSRWGGEEFLLLINETNKHHVHKIADRIRKGIQKQPIIINDEHTVHLTASIGLTMYSNHSIFNLDDLIKQADQALYKGKSLGRNKVINF